jgi:hypothetical protein
MATGTAASTLDAATSAATGAFPYVDVDLSFTAGTLDSSITFSRTSVAWVTDSTGLLVPVAHNFLVRSSEFDNASWTKTEASVVANATTAPDGTVTADKLVDTVVSSVHAVTQGLTLLASTAYTFSAYAKQAELAQLVMSTSAIFVSGGSQIEFDLSTGIATRDAATIAAGVTATMTSVGSGWYRCSWTGTTLSAGSATLGLRIRNISPSTYAGTGTSGLYVWGAQVEQYSSLRAYNPTTSAAYYAPAFDYRYNAASGVWLPQGFRVEDNRINLITSSGDLTGTGWSTANIGARTGNALASPDGTTTATLLNDNSTSVAQYTDRNPAIPGVDTNYYTWSCYVKAGTSDVCQLRIYMIGGGTPLGTGVGATFTFSTKTLAVSGTSGAGAATAADGGFVEVGNGWYRVWVRIQNNNTGNTSLTCRIFPALASLSATSTGTIYAWGAQAELGTVPSSYIPTTTAAVTRAPDTPTIASIPWLNPAAGTFVVEYSLPAIGALNFLQTVFSADDATSNERYTLRSSGTATGGGLNAIVIDGGVTQASIGLTSTLSGGTIHRTSFAYALNDIATSLNGAAVVPDASATLPTVSRLTLGNRLTNGDCLTGTLRRFQYFPTRKTNAELLVLSLPTVTGAVASTLGTCTSSGTGAHGAAGTGASTLDALTSSAAGSSVTGTGSATLAALTSAATGSTVTGTASTTLDSLTSAGTGAHGAAGTGSATLADLTSAALAGSGAAGTASAILADLTGSATGAHGAAGTGAAELSPATGAAIGIVLVTGTASASLDDLLGLSSGIHIQPRIGVGETTLDDLTASGLGTVTWPPPRVRQVTLHATIRGYAAVA